MLVTPGSWVWFPYGPFTSELDLMTPMGSLPNPNILRDSVNWANKHKQDQDPNNSSQISQRWNPFSSDFLGGPKLLYNKLHVLYICTMQHFMPTPQTSVNHHGGHIAFTPDWHQPHLPWVPGRAMGQLGLPRQDGQQDLEGRALTLLSLNHISWGPWKRCQFPPSFTLSENLTYISLNKCLSPMTLTNKNHWWTFSSSSTKLEVLFFLSTKLLLHMWKRALRQGFCLLAFFVAI